jgi:leader peptidase (prepilin peptidase)/N-methyltransferase
VNPVSALLAETTTMTESLAELGVFAAASLPILFADIREKRIPTVWVAAAAVAVIVVRLAWGRFSWWQLAEGGIGWGAVWLIWYASGERIGLGDAKLSALIALLLGWRGWLVAIFLASFAGTVVAVASRRGSRGGAIAFAPFLCFGAVAAFWLQRPLWSMFA